MDRIREYHLLRFSYALAFLVGVAGVAFGFWIRSQSIVFLGCYSVIDGAMTVLAVVVSRIVSQEGNRRLRYGYWHLEPIVLGFNGIIVSLACTYAFINSAHGLLKGGHLIDFSLGAFYALAVSIVSFVMSLFIRRRAQKLASELLGVDYHTWLVGGALGAAFAVAFLSASLLSGIGYGALARYADSFVLATLSSVLAFVRVRSVALAVREVMQVTPTDLDEEVCRVMANVTAEYGFLTYSSYVVKSGHAHFIEIHIVTPPDFAKGGVAELDEVRQDIADRLGEPGAPRWLTIIFTTRSEYI